MKKDLLPGKDPAYLTAREINDQLDRIDSKRSELGEVFINLGWGHLYHSEVVAQHGDNPAVIRYEALGDRRRALRAECEARYGPDFTGRLPIKRGWFGPTKKEEAGE